MRTILLLLVVAGLTGCASVDVPTVDDPSLTIAKAEERGVEDNPDARFHLDMARESLAEARQFMDEDEEKEAKLALMRADADAELALAMVRRDSTRAEVQEVQSQIEELQQDVDRAQKISQ